MSFTFTPVNASTTANASKAALQVQQQNIKKSLTASTTTAKKSSNASSHHSSASDVSDADSVDMGDLLLVSGTKMTIHKIVIDPKQQEEEQEESTSKQEEIIAEDKEN